jgi:hypothetical protein
MRITQFSAQLKKSPDNFFTSLRKICEQKGILASIQHITFGDWAVWPPVRER